MATTASNENAYWTEDDGFGFDNDTSKAPTGNRGVPSDKSAHPSSQLFTVRLWPEITAQGPITWRGKVQCVPNGAWRYFHEWQELNTFLQSQIEEFANTVQHTHDTQPNP